MSINKSNVLPMRKRNGDYRPVTTTAAEDVTQGNSITSATSNTGNTSNTGTDTNTGTGTDWEKQQADALAGFDELNKKNQKEIDDLVAQRAEAGKQVGADINDAAQVYKPKSAAEIADEDKLARQRKMWAGISDGLSALSNIYFTTKGAPSTFDPKATMSEREQQRYDKMLAERRANNEQYIKLKMNHWRMLDDVIKDKQNIAKAQQLAEQRYIELMQKAQLTEERAKLLRSQGKAAEALVEERQAIADKNEAQKILYQVKAELEPRIADARIGKYKADEKNSLAGANEKDQRAAGIPQKQEDAHNESVTRQEKNKQQSDKLARENKKAADREARRNGGNGGNNTPPSRQGKTSNNTPPSRRK